MALIKCPECGKQISDKSATCIHCGFPIQETIEEDKVLRKELESNISKLSNDIIETMDEINIEFRDGYRINYYKGIIKLYDNGNLIIEKSILKTSILEIKETIWSEFKFSIMIDPKVPNEYFCINEEDLNKCRAIKEDLEYRRKVRKDIQETSNRIASPKFVNYADKFTGVYRYNWHGEKQEVYCPRCESENCSHYQQQRFQAGKTKTSYNLNLNPLKPFTLVNKKEKVISKDRVVTENRFICNECGKIFD